MMKYVIIYQSLVKTSNGLNEKSSKKRLGTERVNNAFDEILALSTRMQNTKKNTEVPFMITQY